jgi:hypothetical protein
MTMSHPAEEFRCRDCQHVTTTRMRRGARLALSIMIVTDLALLAFLATRVMGESAAMSHGYVQAVVVGAFGGLVLILAVALWAAKRVFLYPRERCWKCGKRGVVVMTAPSAPGA